VSIDVEVAVVELVTGALGEVIVRTVHRTPAAPNLSMTRTGANRQEPLIYHGLTIHPDFTKSIIS